LPYDCPELPLIESEQSAGRFYEAVSQHRYAGLQRGELHSSSDSLLTDPRLRKFRAIESKASRSYRRLARVVSNVVLGTPAYGVIRANALKRTRLIDAFFLSDYILFAELAMLGEIWGLPELLLRKRFHPARFMAANKTVQDYEARLNPQGPRHIRLFRLVTNLH
jgi:hypothetical protein